MAKREADHQVVINSESDEETNRFNEKPKLEAINDYDSLDNLIVSEEKARVVKTAPETFTS